MKKQTIIFLLFVAFTSCRESTHDMMQLLIKNDTNSELTIHLYPKQDQMYGTMYKDEKWHYRDTLILLPSGSDTTIYTTYEQLKPNELAAQVFDSIDIVSSNQNVTTLKFAPDTVIAYSENLYQSNSFWIYGTYKEYGSTLGEATDVYHNYTFRISEKKYE